MGLLPNPPGAGPIGWKTADMSAQGPWTSGGYPPGQPPPGSYPQPPPGGRWYGPPGRYPAPRPPTPLTVIFGRIITFLGIAAALTSSVIWMSVGSLSLAAGPLCTECMKGWIPPVAIGALGPILPLVLWTGFLIVQWRRPLLLLWSLLGWPFLGVTNIVALGGFAALFSQ